MKGKSSLNESYLYWGEYRWASPSSTSRTSQGFRVFGFDNVNQYSKNIGGKDYTVIEQRYVLIGDEAGEFVIPPFVAQVTIPSRSRRSQRISLVSFSSSGTPKRIKSPATPLTVKALPTNGRTKQFSGLVGNFSIQGDLKPKQAQVGDNISVNISIVGDGETTGMKELLLDLPRDKFKVYEDKPVDGDALDFEKACSAREILTLP